MWEVVAKVGGIANIFTLLFSYAFNKYSVISFKIKTINELFLVKTKEGAPKDIFTAFEINFW